MHSFRLRRPSRALPIGSRINCFRFNTGDSFAVLPSQIAEVRGTSCGALDLEFDAEEDAARELHSQCDLRDAGNLSARDPFPPLRGHRLPLDYVSLNLTPSERE